MSTDNSLSVVIPAKDEAGNIGQLVTEIHQVLRDYPHYEIVVVDDGSDDHTLETARRTAEALHCSFKGLRHEYSIGQSGALLTGIRAATGALIVTMDGDGQNDPTDIPEMLRLAQSYRGRDFCINGFRINRRDTTWKRLQSRLANRIRSTLLGDGIPDSGCGLKLFPKATFLKLPWFDHGHRFLPALVKSIGGELDMVVVNHRERRSGRSNYNAWNRAWAGLLDLAGVMWLLHRTRVAQVQPQTGPESR